MMKKTEKIFVAGATGMVGSAIVNKLVDKGYENIIGSFHSRSIATNKNIKYQQIDLADNRSVKVFFENEKPDYVFLAAAKVGGIIANNTYRAQFIYENLQIQNNIIHQSYLSGVKKLLFLGSSCIYPRNCKQPMKEEYLLGSQLEYTNEPYAIAKIAGIKMCESYNLQYGSNYIAVMPTNLYGQNDNFDLEKSHVLPALIRKMHLSKCLMNNDFDALRHDLQKRPVEGVDSTKSDEQIINILKKYNIEKADNGEVTVTLWGSGTPKREFLHANDLSDACVYIMENIDFKDILKNEFGITNNAPPITASNIRNTHINIGAGKDISIAGLADLVKEATGFTGNIKWDTSKPDGTMQKLLDVSKLKNYGWEPDIKFANSLTAIYDEYCV